jgi:cytochrome c oxidase accessory protein FixG
MCPQTIFLEIVFRRIEVWIEGSPAKQRKLNEGPWNGEKILKKIAKWVIFYTLSFAFVNIIIWYFMSFDKWLLYASEMDKHIPGIILIFIFTTAFFGIYLWFREQICLIACPYGRMQGVLIDPSTIVISYDYLRGEPRGHQKKGQVKETGDCIDCHACVDVCPTGIDIRNGTQLECVNCSACIDACDTVMDKVKKPKGLIRYASEKEISTGKKVGFSPRIIAYSFVLVGLLAFFFTMLFTRSDVEVVVLRTPGLLYQEVGTDSLSNLYNIKVVNKTRQAQKVDIKLSSIRGEVKIIGGELTVRPGEKTESVLFVKISKKDVTDSKFKIALDVVSGGEIVDKIKITFISPNIQ